MQEDTSREVHITWSDRNGHACNGCSGRLGHIADQVSTFTVGGLTTESLWYSFSNTSTNQQGLVINEMTSISKFMFRVVAGGHTQVEDQGGVGFAIQDVVMLALSSCDAGNDIIKLDIAVRLHYLKLRFYLH